MCVREHRRRRQRINVMTSARQIRTNTPRTPIRAYAYSYNKSRVQYTLIRGGLGSKHVSDCEGWLQERLVRGNKIVTGDPNVLSLADCLQRFRQCASYPSTPNPEHRRPIGARTYERRDEKGIASEGRSPAIQLQCAPPQNEDMYTS